MEYLRLSVTDRCNLRCFYCMPSNDMKFLPRKELLSYEELEALVQSFVGLGINKIRITGGEPFLRKDLMDFLGFLRSDFPQLKLAITSNGVLLGKYFDQLLDLNINQINLSLDTLDPGKFLRITGSDRFDVVFKTLFDLLEKDFSVKLNCVVMKGVNDEEIISFAELTKDFPISVRFIEEMPFNGLGNQRGFMNHIEIRKVLTNRFGKLDFKAVEMRSPSLDSKINGYQGSIGIIPAYTRSFCGQCNRIRVSATGKIKTCLYGNDTLDLRELVRSGVRGEEIKSRIISVFKGRPKDGHTAEKKMTGKSSWSSMSEIGG
jgi:GTP 3',8-cyclase